MVYKYGKLKSNLNLDEIKNQIRLDRDDLSWIGIDIKGTNVIVRIVEAKKEPEIIDENTPCNIVADKNGVISKMIVRSGTARVSVGDIVSIGDILVEGVMEGQYTGIREVNSDADIYSISTYEKEKKETFIQEVENRTGNEEKNIELYINNFKIFFNKGVTKFQNYDTIRTYKKVKLFSNYYIPIEIVTVTNYELEKNLKTYTENELTEKISKQLYSEIGEEIDIENSNQVDMETTSFSDIDGVTVKVTCRIEEKIGTKE